MKATTIISPLLLLLSSADAATPKLKPRTALLPPSLSVRGGGETKESFSPFTTPTTRGGGVSEATANIDKSGTWSMSDLGTSDFIYLGIHISAMTAVVVFCRTWTRSGGQAPTWISDYVPEPYASGVLHLAFFALGFLGRSILPNGLAKMVYAPATVALLGTVFPAIESVQAAVTDGGEDDRTWLMYWVVHGIFQYSTEFMDQLALKFEFVYKYWHTFEVLAVIWLILPLTDGATLIYKTIAKPYLLPLVLPLKKYCDGWIATLALTSLNASYLWWFSFIFMSLPVMIKRYCVMGVGSIFPVAATVVALTASKDSKQVMRWLTYWPCFGLLFLVMIGVEKFVGSFKGLYVMCLAATMYLMLPMFDGSTLVFREILVPLLRQQELLYIRDARMLAAQFLKNVPAHRQEDAMKAAANAFVKEDSQ